MTLILTAISEKVIVHAADTRLSTVSSSGEIIRTDDGNVKQIVLNGNKARFVLSYTGIAHLQSKRTDVWLTDFLFDNDCANQTIESTVNTLKDSLSKAVTQRDANNRITVVISGVGYTEAGTYSQSFVLSNFEYLENGRLKQAYFAGDFAIYISANKKEAGSMPIQLSIFGAVNVIQNRLFLSRIKKIKKTLRSLRAGHINEVMSSFSHAINIAAADSNYGLGISERSIVTVLPLTGDTPTTRTFPTLQDSKFVTSHLVVPGAAFRNIQIEKIGP